MNLENLENHAKWKKSDKIMPNRVWSHLYEMFIIWKIIKQKADWCLPRKEGEWRTGATTTGHDISFWIDENILELDSGDGYTTL